MMSMKWSVCSWRGIILTILKIKTKNIFKCFFWNKDHVGKFLPPSFDGHLSNLTSHDSALSIQWMICYQSVLRDSWDDVVIKEMFQRKNGDIKSEIIVLYQIQIK